MGSFLKESYAKMSGEETGIDDLASDATKLPQILKAEVTGVLTKDAFDCLPYPSILSVQTVVMYNNTPVGEVVLFTLNVPICYRAAND